MKQLILTFMALILLGMQVGCGGKSSGGGAGGDNSPTKPRPQANHPLAKMIVEDVNRVHEVLAGSRNKTPEPRLRAHAQRLSKLYAIVVQQLRLTLDLVVTDLDRRMFLRFHALLMDSSFKVYPNQCAVHCARNELPNFIGSL